MLTAIATLSIFAVVAAAGIVFTVRAVAVDGYRATPNREFVPVSKEA